MSYWLLKNKEQQKRLKESITFNNPRAEQDYDRCMTLLIRLNDMCNEKEHVLTCSITGVIDNDNGPPNGITIMEGGWSVQEDWYKSDIVDGISSVSFSIPSSEYLSYSNFILLYSFKHSRHLNADDWGLASKEATDLARKLLS